MTDRISVSTFFGLPAEFVGLVLTLAFVFALAPYLEGRDFGVVKIPRFGKTARTLRFVGPLLLLLSLGLVVPVLRNPELTVVDHNLRQDDVLELKLLNPAKHTVIVHRAEVTVHRIWVLIPNRVNTMALDPSKAYVVTIPIRQFPYRQTIPLSQKLSGDDADFFTIKIGIGAGALTPLRERRTAMLLKEYEMAQKQGRPWLEGSDYKRRDANFRNSLHDSDWALLKALDITPELLDFPTDVCVRFELRLLFNRNRTVRVDDFLICEGPSRLQNFTVYDTSDTSPLSRRNMTIARELKALKATRSYLAQTIESRLLGPGPSKIEM